MNCANHQDRERIAFCQNCGKPLCQECMRAVGSAVFCEPCLAAKLAGTAPPAAGAYTDPAVGSFAAGSFASGTIPPRPLSGAPNPWLAALLGFIPGVGAMYNEQYVKGIVHLLVFAVLVSLKDINEIFGLLVAGWIFYMVIEAHHTARARRDGLPLPNPFGLNEIGDRLGFNKGWGSATNSPSAPGPVPPDPYAAAYTSSYSAPPVGTPFGYAPPVPPYAASAVPPNWGVPPVPGWEQYVPPVPPIPQVPLDAQVPYPGNRFPAGAIWLIGFGVLFLIANAGFFHGFSERLFLPVLLIGLAVFIFVRKMTSYGGALSSDGSPDYRLRIFRALRGSVWVALVGLLFFLDEFGILSWAHSWPLFIILAGVMTVLERTAYNVAAVPPYTPGYGAPYGYPPQPPVTPPHATSGSDAQSQSTAIVPLADDTLDHHQEGR